MPTQQKKAKQESDGLKIFSRMVTATLIAVVLVMCFGGLVRASGAGLGCPDWPRCWGRWLPPNSVSEIALEKINRAKIPVEFQKLADPRTAFNREKMWIEYLNRMVGVVAGLFVLATFLASLRFVRTKPWLVVGAFFALFLIGLNAWLGALVVKEGLAAGMITIHFACALSLLALLSWMAAATGQGGLARSISKRLSLILAIVVSLQILFGTRVREALDEVSRTQKSLPRAEWIEAIPGITDHLHRASSWIVLGLAWLVFWQHWKERKAKVLRIGVPGWILPVVIGQIVVGVVAAYGGLPPAAQFFHLALSSILAALAYLCYFQSLQKNAED